MEEAIKTRKPKQRPKHLLSTFIAYFFIMLLVFHTRDFLTAIVKDQYSYELKFQQVETEREDEKSPKVWQLYRNGEFFKFVNPSDYNLPDRSGNIDLKYCTIVYEAKGLVYSAILTAMLVLVLIIAGSCKEHTPFTRSNANRIKVIAILQFSLAIAPGLLEFIMKSVKYEYSYGSPRIESLYMLVIGFVILMISKIFNQGVELQEENDLIA